jgi:hypothetical protein
MRLALGSALAGLVENHGVDLFRFTRSNPTVDNIFRLPVIPVPGYPMMQQIAAEQERGCIRLIQPRYQTHRQNG